jgi:2-(1,2-epoxy-1,2-dihydrophenyl)acetyl-CoA isomerase
MHRADTKEDEMELKTVIYKVEDGVAWIILNRPERRNAINLQICIDMRRAALTAERDDAARAVVVTGAGTHFCAGADLSPNTSGEPDIPVYQMFKETNLYFHSAIATLINMRKPVIAAMNGSAAGAGTSLAFACDLMYAKESVKMNWAFTQRGLTPDGASSQNLARKVGIHRAMEIAFTGKVLTAREAREWGILNEVFTDGAFESSIREIAAKIASGPTWSYGTTKLLIRQGFFNQPETQMEIENNCISEAATKEDFTEGVLSFLEKRAPKFKGK